MRILIRGIYGLSSVHDAETGAWKGENVVYLMYERNKNAEWENTDQKFGIDHRERRGRLFQGGEGINVVNATKKS